MHFYRTTFDLHPHHLKTIAVNYFLRAYIWSGYYALDLSFLKNPFFPADVQTAQLTRYHFYVGFLKALSHEYKER
jgi:hypothetical protein